MRTQGGTCKDPNYAFSNVTEMLMLARVAQLLLMLARCSPVQCNTDEVQLRTEQYHKRRNYSADLEVMLWRW